jgi:hypothetical protein
MAGYVYHPFSKNDVFSTTVWTQPSVTWWVEDDNGPHGGGPHSTLGFPSGVLSLYGGLRAREDVYSGSAGPVQIYPLDDVDTHSIDRVIQVAGQYPATGSIHFTICTNTESPNGLFSVTPDRWYDEHYRPIELLYSFYNQYRPNYLLLTGTFPTLRVFDIPSMHYDRQIATGSVRFVDWTRPSASFIGPGVFYDNGRGDLILSGAFESDGTPAKFGNVFYVEGLIVIYRPYTSSGQPYGNWSGSLFSTEDQFTYNLPVDFTTTTYPVGYGASPTDLYYPNSANSGVPQYRSIELSFSGSHPVVTKTFMCRAGQGELNASNNPTWSLLDDIDNQVKRVWAENTTYITAIGLYNEHRQLVAVAKLAQPIRKREKDNLNIRLRLDL